MNSKEFELRMGLVFDWESRADTDQDILESQGMSEKSPMIPRGCRFVGF